MRGATAIPDKVLKMIPRLASDHDGEVVATVAAIRRTLEGAGLSLHDLAAAVSAPPVIWRAPTPEPPRQTRAAEPRFTFSNLSPGDARRTIAKIADYTSLTTWESDFLASIAEQLRSRPDKLLSTAQVKTLNGIWRKTVGAE
jgi:hypothetical protein